MIVKMNEKTYAYIYKKGKVLTIDMIIPKGCCGGMSVPQILFKKPDDNNKYISLSYQDIIFYINKAMVFTNDVFEIVLKKTFFINDLELPTLKVL
ncbi:MAG: CC/Se motif family (seleno)protein [Thermotaleaceae bacterium]